MSELAYLSNAAKQLQELNQELETDKSTEAYARAVTLEAWASQLTEEELRVVLGGAYNNEARFWLEARLVSNTQKARAELEKAMGNEPTPEETSIQAERGRLAMIRETDQWAAEKDGWTGD